MATAAHFDGSQALPLEIIAVSSTEDGKEVRSRVRQALQHGVREFVFDCERWHQLDLRVLSSLVQCAAACREHGATFDVANMSSTILKDVRELRLAERLGLVA
jgi:hypothetical protein